MQFFLDQMDVHQCSFCGRGNQTADENGWHLTMKHYGQQCIVCSSCQDKLWIEHEAQFVCNANYADCHPTDRSYQGAKKQKF